MKTVVIRVEEFSTAKKGYPVLLHLNDGKAKWGERDRALAKAVIKRNLSVSSPPKDPQDGENLKPENLRKILLSETGASRRLEAVGDYLHKLLIRDKVEEEWLKLCDKYPGERGRKEGRRTILDIAPKELRLLPWELMATDKPMFMDPTNPVSRGPLQRPARQVCYQWPLHVLVVVGSDANDPAVQAEAEIASIEEALLHFDIPVELDILKRPTHQDLVDTLESFRPHIFHFIGHGRKAFGPRNVPVLAFEAGASGEAWEWNERMIAVDLNTWTPRLAFINACRSSTEEEADHTWGITQRFISAGVPAVIGMQADISGSAAAMFPGEIYKALSQDSALDVALAKARGDVSRNKRDGMQRRDWALATFHLSVDPVKVVDMKPPATDAFRSEINQQFADIKLFVDRVEPRRKLWRAVEQTPSADQSKRLLIIRGILESGKTWLVYWCLRSCKWRDLNVHYVSLKKKTTRNDGAKNIVEVLRAIIASDPNSQFGQPLPAQAFYRFNAVVNYLLNPGEPNPSSIPAKRRVDDKGYPFKEDLDDESIHTILGEFKLGLRNASQRRTLVLALDDVSRGEVRKDHFQNYLLPDLIGPIARGAEPNLKNIRLILALKEDEYGELGLSELENFALNIKLNWLDKKELCLFVRDLCILKQIPRDKIELLLDEVNVSTVAPSIAHDWLMMWSKHFIQPT